MKRKSEPLFDAYIVENGKRRRMNRDEIRECWRLWRKHADIRLGKLRRAA